MIKAIILSFVGLSYSIEITITKEFIYQEMTSSLENKVDKRYIIYDLGASKTHVIESGLKSRTIIDTEVHKDNWTTIGKTTVSQKIKSDKIITYHGLECILFEEVIGMEVPEVNGDDDPVELVTESYQCNLKPLQEYLDLEEDAFKVLFFYKNLVHSHPFEMAKWNTTEIGNKVFISPPLEKIDFTEIQDFSFIEKLLSIPTK